MAVSELKSDHQAQIDRILGMFTAGWTNRQITDQLNSEAELTPRGKRFTTNHVHSMIKKGMRRRDRIAEIGTILNLKVWVAPRSNAIAHDQAQRVLN